MILIPPTRINLYDEPDFDSVLDYDDIEAGMTIEAWWPFCENEKFPSAGRFREVHVIGTEVQNDQGYKLEHFFNANRIIPLKICIPVK